MPATENPFIALPAMLLDSSVLLSRASLETVAKLNNLQLQAFKVSFQEAGEQLAQIYKAPDLQTASDALNDWLAPGSAKFESWLGHIHHITAETGTELASVMEKQIAGNGSSLQTALGTAALETPAGSQGTFPGMQPAVSEVTELISSKQKRSETNAASRRTSKSSVQKVRRPTTRELASKIKV